MSYNIAIDGPAGAGKSTIAKKVAKELGFIYVDTGAMYRSIALYFLRNQVDITAEAQVASALDQIDVKIRYEEGTQHVLLNGEDVSTEIRQEAVGNMASNCGTLPLVREKLLKIQRNIAEENNVVMDGRDIGTNILPKAQIKVFLTASVEERASRRFREYMEKGQNADINAIRMDIEQRDYQDSHREIAPLSQAADAVYLDSSDLTIDEVVGQILELSKKNR